MIKKILQYSLPLGVAVLLMWWVYKDTDFNEMKRQLSGANFLWIFLSTIPMTLSHLFRAQRWRLLLQPLGRTPSLLNTFLAVMTGYFANLLIPRMGEVTRCLVLKRTDDVPVEEGGATVVTERIFDLVVLAIISAIAIFSDFGHLGKFLQDMLEKKKEVQQPAEEKSYLGYIIFLAIVLLGFIAWKLTARLGIHEKIKAFIANAWKAFLSVKDMKRKWEFLLHSVLIWLGYFTSCWMGLEALKATSGLGFFGALNILVAGSFGMVAPVQGGVGPYHYMVTQALTKLYNVAEVEAGASAFLLHTSSTVYTALIGALCGALTFILAKNEKSGK